MCLITPACNSSLPTTGGNSHPNTTVTPFLSYIPGMAHSKKQTMQSNIHVNIGLHYTGKVLLKYKRYACM